jgi:hypothetical protein
VRACVLALGSIALVVAAVAWPASAGANATVSKHHHKHHVKKPKLKRNKSLLLGINIPSGASEAEAATAISAAKAIHSRVVRIELRWAALEPVQGEIAPDALAPLENIVNTAAANGLRVITLVQGTPCWASSAPAAIESACVPGAESQANAWPPSNDATFGTFLAKLAAQYRSKLDAIEVWNEPDYAGENYLAGPNKAEAYAGLLKAAYPAVKAVDPEISVLGGAFVGSNGIFLRDLYADGIKGYYDALAVHFYTDTLASLRAIHEVQKQYHDTKPLWLTEVGWPSCYPAEKTQKEQSCVTPKVQAENVVNMTRTLAHTSYVGAEVLYKLTDAGGEDFGALTATGAQKPSFTAIAGVFASPFGNPSPVILRVRHKHGKLIASGSAPVGDLVELEVFKHGKREYLSIFGLTRFNTYSATLPAALGTKGLKIRIHQEGMAPRSGATAHA